MRTLTGGHGGEEERNDCDAIKREEVKDDTVDDVLQQQNTFLELEDLENACLEEHLLPAPPPSLLVFIISNL